MTNEEKILQELEEIKQALKHIYGEGEEQDGLISSLERNLRLSTQTEIAKLQRSLDDINYKLASLPKIMTSLTTITKSLHGIDLYDLKSDVDRIHNILVTYESKLSSIDRKLR